MHGSAGALLTWAGLGSARLGLLTLYSQLKDELVAACSGMASVGTVLFTSKFFLLHFSRLMGLVLAVMAGIQESKLKYIRPLRPRLRIGIIFLMSHSQG